MWSDDKQRELVAETKVGRFSGERRPKTQHECQPIGVLETRPTFEKVLAQYPFCVHLIVFRGRRGDHLKAIWWNSQSACLFSKWLERGKSSLPFQRIEKIRLDWSEFINNWVIKHSTVLRSRDREYF